MRRSLVYLILGAILLAFGCSEERVTAPPAPYDDAASSFDASAAAWGIVEQAGWPAEVPREELEVAGVAQCHGGHFPIHSFEREEIIPGVAHYSCQVRSGQGPYGMIGIHRVVKETSPGHPILTPNTVFLLHGDWVGFETCFLPGTYSPTAPAEFGIAAYLAQGDVDVWGIDQAWYLIPEGVTNFNFMKHWGVQREVDHLNDGIAVARIVRLLTGNGVGKVHLLGFSSGSMTGYALLNQETQVPEARRQVKGLIPVDWEMKTNSEPMMAADREYLEYLRSLYDSRVYQEDVFFRPLAELARMCPDDPSPFMEGFTNWQAVFVIFASPLSVDYAGHYVAGVWEEVPPWPDPLPVDFRFTPVDRWLDFMAHGAVYEPILFEVQMYEMEVDPGNLPFDDHLSEITVPILAVGAGGGFMPNPYMDELVGSTDFTELVVRLEGHSYEEALLDIAHCDIFLADNAPGLFWQPILEWIHAHPE